MRVHLTRDSVSMGDDVDAPHERATDLPGEMPVREAIAAVVEAGYLARIGGGKATWVLTGAGAPIAVVAQEWAQPELITHKDTRLTALANGEGTIHWHFVYQAQRDPGEVYEELRTASAT